MLFAYENLCNISRSDALCIAFNNYLNGYMFKGYDNFKKLPEIMVLRLHILEVSSKTP